MTKDSKSIGLRWPWVGDLLASVFVGYSLLWGYAYLHASIWQPVAVGYLVPFLVYCFSTFWNARPFLKRRAVTISVIMGTIFFVVHRIPLPHLVSIGTGFAAPVIVSWWARRGKNL